MKKSVCFTLACTFLLNGCAQLQPVGHQLHDSFASDDPCSNNARNTGTAIGTLIGAGLGVAASQATGGGNREAMLLGAAIGAGAGGLLGWQIGSNRDQERCALYKISQRYNINLRSLPILLAGVKEPIGLSINLPDTNATGHFAANSAVLTATAKKYFTEIARQYSVSYQLNSLPARATENEKAVIRQQLADKKILLVGHTDDTGNTQYNAELSERRARAVAHLFNENGVALNNLLYQGAGETLPIASNQTEEGRRLNRRVEIIDVNDELALKQYLAARQPNLAFYRAAATATALAASQAVDSSAGTGSGLDYLQRDPVGKRAVSSGKQAATVKIKNRQAAHVPRKQPSGKVSTPQALDELDLAGQLATDKNRGLNIGNLVQEPRFSLFSQAYAADSTVLHSCGHDRPRAAGLVKQLRDGKVYAVRDHLPGMYGNTWVDRINGNLIAINHLSVLRDSAQADQQPLINIYKDYQPNVQRNPKPYLSQLAQVNTYRADKGILYRIFLGQKGLQCMDVLLPLNGGREAHKGLILYRHRAESMVTSFKPKAN